MEMILQRRMDGILVICPAFSSDYTALKVIRQEGDPR